MDARRSVHTGGTSRVRGSFNCCGVRIDALGVDDAAGELLARAVNRQPTVVHFCNAYVVALASRDAPYASLLNRGDLNLPDGKSVAWVGRYLGFDFLRRSVPGPDIFERVVAAGRVDGVRHYLYGSTPGVIDALVERLTERFPGVAIAGCEAPPFKPLTPEEESATIRRIRDSDADVVWIGLGTPKQDVFIERVADHLDAVLVPVGAAFDFVAGTRSRAPQWLRDIGLEWLYRLATEPRRLLRRYVIGNIRFLACAMRTASVAGPRGAPDEGDDATPVLAPQLWRRKLRRILVAADAAVIGISSFASYGIRVLLGQLGAVGPFQTEVPTALGVLPLWLTILALFGCYHPAYLSAGGDAARRFVGGTTVGVLVLGFVSFLFRLDLSRIYVALMFGLVLVLGTGVRLALRRYILARRSRGRLKLRVLIVGYDDDARRVARAMTQDPAAGYDVRGFVADDAPNGGVSDDDIPVVGRTREVRELAYRYGAGLVVISPTAVPSGLLQDVTVALEGSPIDVAVAPSLFEVVTRRVAIESVGNVPLLHIDQIRLSWGRAAVKRVMDLVVSLVLLLALGPIMAVSAVAVKAHDGGRVLFRQERIGRDGRRFVLLKFRTMVPDAEERLPDVQELNEAGHHFFKVRDDPRVTKVGRVLRRWSIDETPQLINILKGHMSLVGPRPPLPREVALYEPWHLRRLRVRPGLTGIWQVSGRSDVPFDEAVRMDLFYIENWSLAYDVVLLTRTVGAVLGRRGAY